MTVVVEAVLDDVGKASFGSKSQESVFTNSRSSNATKLFSFEPLFAMKMICNVRLIMEEGFLKIAHSDFYLLYMSHFQKVL